MRRAADGHRQFERDYAERARLAKEEGETEEASVHDRMAKTHADAAKSYDEILKQRT